MYVIKVIKSGNVIGYRADTTTFATVAEIDHARLFDSRTSVTIQVLGDAWENEQVDIDDFEIVEL